MNTKTVPVLYDHRNKKLGVATIYKDDNSIRGFRRKYLFLSNFYPCMVELDGVLYQSVEHAFQAAKSKDPEVRKHFRSMNGSETAKYFGRHLDEVKPGTLLRGDWDQVITI